MWSLYPPKGSNNAEGKEANSSSRDVERTVFSHQEYVDMIWSTGHPMTHSLGHEQSAEEDPRMIAFFDSLVQRELDNSASTSNSDTDPRSYGFVYSSTSSSSESDETDVTETWASLRGRATTAAHSSSAPDFSFNDQTLVASEVRYDAAVEQHQEAVNTESESTENMSPLSSGEADAVGAVFLRQWFQQVRDEDTASTSSGVRNDVSSMSELIKLKRAKHIQNMAKRKKKEVVKSSSQSQVKVTIEGEDTSDDDVSEQAEAGTLWGK